MIEHDVVVIGGGLAGTRAALEVYFSGVDVAIVSKLHPMRSHSVAAAGGINAAVSEEDSWEGHMFDTVKGSDYLADQEAAEVFCQDAAAAVIQMEHWGTPFSRGPDGKLASRPFGGHGMPRAYFAGDRTGLMLLNTTFEQVMKEGVTVYDEWTVTNLAVEDGSCRGVFALELATGELHAIMAKAVIFATGPAGQIYQKSTNAVTCTGDGLAIALRAGIPLKDMEFVQFHPTSLWGPNVLITEAARGEGGRLFNAKGERFMERYAPKTVDMAPRDIVSRSIITEVREGRAFEGGYVHLDLTHLGADYIKERLPEVVEFSRDFAGVDATQEPIPVEPAQHYMMGGIDVAINGATVMPGVYAAGECACVSLHGSNRLGGNALLECLVFGRMAGSEAAEFAKKRDFADIPAEALKAEEERIYRILKREDGERPAYIRREMQQAMHEHVGVFRIEEEMREALRKVKELQERFKSVYVDDKGKVFNQNLVDTLELQNMLTVAEVIALGALTREESRGAHYRADFSKRDDDEWLKHTIASLVNGEVVLSYTPVSVTRFKPEARVY
ncbi:MAG: FAD-binding protein [Thermoplasmata archaeon]